MKKLMIAAVLLASTGIAYAEQNDYDRDRDYARVISIQPHYVTTNQQVCQQGTVTRSNQGTDTAIGAGVGAVTGAVIAGRHDKLLGGVIGGVAGAVIGNEVGKDSTTTTPTTVCHYEPMTVRNGDIVTFEYRGVRFTQMFGQ